MKREEALKLIPEKSWIRFAGGRYRVAGIVDLFGAMFVEIYDEPPSQHIDRIKIDSVELISNQGSTAQQPQKEQEEEVSHDNYKKALKMINKYYRQVSGRKECIAFHVKYIQPIEEFIKQHQTTKQP